MAFGLAPLFEHSTVQKFVERFAAPRRFEHAIERVQPHWSFQFNLAKHGLKSLRHITEVDFGIVHAGGRELAEILHQQEINLVADRVRLRCFRQKMLQQRQHSLGIHYRTGLEELAQLMHLDALVHFVQPAGGLFDHFFARSLDASLEFRVRLHVDGELTREFEINGIQPACKTPLGGEILSWYG